MPIYAYRCTSCGHAKDVLQKMSDPLLTVCPDCGAATFVKQVTAAGFQLKGSGWYVTDFRGGNTAAKPADAAAADGGGPAEPAKSGGDAAKPDTPAAAPAPAAAPSGTKSAAAPAAAPAPAAPTRPAK